MSSAMNKPGDLELKISNWIQQRLAISFSAGESLATSLKNGVILCKLINTLRPGSVAKIYEGGLPFKQMENIANYLKACEKIGLPDRELFLTVDLFEEKDMSQVLNNLNAVQRYYSQPAKPSSIATTTTSSTSPTSSSSSAAAKATKISRLVKEEATKVAKVPPKSRLPVFKKPVPTAPSPQSSSQQHNKPKAKNKTLFHAEYDKAPDVSSLDSDISTRQLFKYDPAMETAAREWIEAIINRKLSSPESLHDSLKDGVALCETLNFIKPHTIAKIARGKISFSHMENIESFIKGCTTLGLKQSSLFNTLDLYEEKNMNLVITSIHVLAKHAEKLPGYAGPKMRHVEVSNSPLSIADVSDFSAVDSDDSPIGEQERELISWMNSHLKSQQITVERIRKDCRKGVSLIRLLEILTETPKLGIYQMQPQSLWHFMQNAALVLQFISQQLGQQIKNITGQDIMFGRLEPLINLLTLIRSKFDRGFVFKSENLTDDTCRLRIIQELVETEKTYTTMMHEVWSNIIQSSQQNNLLPQQELDSIFSNLKDILDFNSGLLSNLQQRLEVGGSKPTVSDLFVAQDKWVALYSKYVNNYDMGTLLLRYNKKKSKDFKKLIKEWEKRQKDATGLDLQSYLILPVQRLPRYLLLLKELQRYTPESHSEFVLLNQAVGLVATSLEQINDSRRDADNSSLRLISIDKSLDYEHCEGFDGIVHPKRKYVTEGYLSWEEQEVERPYWFLFNDIFVFCEQLSEADANESQRKQFKYVTMIPLNFVEEVKDNEENENSFDIILEDDTITLEASSTAEKNKWLIAVKETAALKIDLDLVW